MVPIAIAFGSNLGDRHAQIEQALRSLARCIDVQKISSFYETRPMYVESQPPFLNGALIGHSALGPRRLLEVLKRIELEVGRLPQDRYGPREIDLDLIAYGSLSYTFQSETANRQPPTANPNLIVPHPKTPERRFVLEPLCEIAPDFVLPRLGSVKDLLACTADQAGDVKRIEHAVLFL